MYLECFSHLAVKKRNWQTFVEKYQNLACSRMFFRLWEKSMKFRFEVMTFENCGGVCASRVHKWKIQNSSLFGWWALRAGQDGVLSLDYPTQSLAFIKWSNKARKNSRKLRFSAKIWFDNKRKMGTIWKQSLSYCKQYSGNWLAGMRMTQVCLAQTI